MLQNFSYIKKHANEHLKIYKLKSKRKVVEIEGDCKSVL